MNNKNKILILALVVLSIGAVYFLKNSSSKKEDTAKIESNVAKNDNKTENTTNTNNTEKNDNKESNKTTDEKAVAVTPIEPLDADSSISMENLISKGKPFILDFSQKNWYACKVLHPTLVKLHEKYGDQVIIKSIEVSELRDFTSQFPIRVTPTMMYFKADGSPFEPSEALAKRLNYFAYKKTGEEKIALTGSQGVVDYETMEELLKEMGVNVK